MDCWISCGIASAFIVSMIYMNLSKKDILVSFLESLTPDLQEKYKEIMKERLTLYILGFGIGLIVSTLAVFYIRPEPILGACMSMAGTFLFTYFFYMLTPKSDYIIRHLETKEQKEKWLKVYKTMQQTYHTGLVLGLIGATLLGSQI